MLPVHTQPDGKNTLNRKRRKQLYNLRESALLGHGFWWYLKFAIFKSRMICVYGLNLATHNKVSALWCDKKWIALTAVGGASNGTTAYTNITKEYHHVVTNPRCTGQFAPPTYYCADERIMNGISLERRNGFYGI
jgi:hypothetical protein